jgi:hypothetical protein
MVAGVNWPCDTVWVVKMGPSVHACSAPTIPRLLIMMLQATQLTMQNQFNHTNHKNETSYHK